MEFRVIKKHSHAIDSHLMVLLLYDLSQYAASVKLDYSIISCLLKLILDSPDHEGG